MLTTERPSNDSVRRPSPARLAGIGVATGVGWAVGFYLGVFAVLSLVGWSEAAGWQFLLATISGGAVGASTGAMLAHPDTGAAAPAVLGAGLLAGAVALVALQIIGGDFAVAILGGGATVVTATVTASALTASG